MRATEIFYSVQGEGAETGAASIFVRLFGCTLRCPGFGLPKGEKTTEVDEIVKRIDDFKTFMDLPLVHTGCDSYPSVYPQFKRFAQDYTPLEMADKIRSLLPARMNGKFGDHGKAIHVVFTGGEPLLWQDEIADVIKELVKYGLYDITFETNGTVELNNYLSNVLKDFGITVTFSISPKLSASGESYEKAVKPEVIWSYYQHVRDTEDLFLSKAILKFVVAEESDLQEVGRVALDYYREIEDTLPVYLMPAGGCFEEYTALAPKVAQWALDNGYKFSPRLHINIWGNAWAT